MRVKKILLKISYFIIALIILDIPVSLRAVERKRNGEKRSSANARMTEWGYGEEVVAVKGF